MFDASALQGVAGIALFVLIAVAMSQNKRHINWRLVISAIVMQFVICVAFIHLDFLQSALASLNEGVQALSRASIKGTSFVFGYIGGGDAPFDVKTPHLMVTLAFQILPLIIVISALSALLWYWRVLPLLVRVISVFFERALNTRGPAGLIAVINIFLGQVESALMVKPYLSKMSRHDLLLVMTAGMAMIAGSMMVIYSAMLGPQLGPDVSGVLGHLITKSIMSVPASILFAHLLIPEDQRLSPSHDPKAGIKTQVHQPYQSVMDAITRGTSEGLAIYLNVVAILIVLSALVALGNDVLAWLGLQLGYPLSIQGVVGWLFAPVAWFMGVPWHEAVTGGELLGVKTVLNEFLAYLDLIKLPDSALSTHSRLIMIYALCGFANLGSIGIQISGLSAMIPERRDELNSLAWPSFIAAILASCMTGAIVGLVVT
jgi:concentrative nucleoside transporter, CNT family